MEAQFRGGKRKGAGRKPLKNPKKQVSLYIENNKFYKFGGEEKMKEKIYEFVDEYGDTKEVIHIGETPKIFDAPQLPKNYMADEPMFPKELKIVTASDFESRIIECKTVPEIEAVMKDVKSAVLTFIEKKNLEAIAKEVSKDFFTD